MATRLVKGHTVKYFLAGHEWENAFKELKTTQQDTCRDAATRAQKTLEQYVSELLDVSPILVTGSSGYLGSALVSLLRGLKIPVVGLDLCDAPTTTYTGSITDLPWLTKVSKGCRSIFHTAALHAPNLDFYSLDEYDAVNVEGTKNILSLCKNYSVLSLVFSSTTSLMVSQSVKVKESMETVVLDASIDMGPPRNIYGETKKKAEKLCLDDCGSTNVAVLRLSRFFVEDHYDTSVKADERVVKSMNGNVKANELLCGVRASLEDVITANVLALLKITGKPRCSDNEKTVLGPLIVSTISPFLHVTSDQRDLTVELLDAALLEKARKVYTSLGWEFPDRIRRLYDSRATWKALDWYPSMTFHRLMEDIQSSGQCSSNLTKGLF